jgi:replicative DNA helicase
MLNSKNVTCQYNNRIVFENMLELFSKREPIDFLYLSTKLKEKAYLYFFLTYFIKTNMSFFHLAKWL